MQMGLPEYERTNNIRYEDSQPRYISQQIIDIDGKQKCL
jgi:hypothetical protein